MTLRGLLRPQLRAVRLENDPLLRRAEPIAALAAAPSFRTQKPTRARAGSLPFLPKNLLFSSRENSSSLPQFGRPDFRFEFAVKT